jgi:hypothetical protein
MTTIEVYDPAMCCSTGVCGPTVDPALARFEADLRWLSGQGAAVTRYNLGQQPGAFVESPIVVSILQAGGEGVLPVILIDGKLKWTGHYPSRDELAAGAGATAPTPRGEPATACCSTEEQTGDACCAPATAGVQITARPDGACC